MIQPLRQLPRCILTCQPPTSIHAFYVQHSRHVAVDAAADQVLVVVQPAADRGPQLLDRVTVTGSTNRYFTLKPLQLIDAVVRSVVTEDFALGPSVRGWLDDDEYLIRRRIHRDMTTVLNEDGMG